MSAENQQFIEAKPETESPKFCFMCHHIATNGSGDWEKFRCFAPQNKQHSYINLVTGSEVITWIVNSCDSARLNDNLCGKEAKWFKQKEIGGWKGTSVEENSKSIAESKAKARSKLISVEDI